MVEKLITKSFERLLDKGKVRGFITYEELGKSLGKRGGSNENVEKAFLIIRSLANRLGRVLSSLSVSRTCARVVSGAVRSRFIKILGTL